MYFTLEINRQLADAMMAACEFKVEVERIIENVCTDEDRKEYEQMSDDICAMIVSIGRTMGMMLSDIALDEVSKVNPRNNLNIESHVSK